MHVVCRYADCNGLFKDGCEVNTGTDVNNCGACGNQCPSGPNMVATCVGGTCKTSGQVAALPNAVATYTSGKAAIVSCSPG
jgi:hypothetical protein